MTSLHLKIIGSIVSTLLVIGLIFGAKWIYDTLKEQRATINAIQGQAQSASEIGDTASDEESGRTTDTIRVIETRIEYRDRYVELKNENPDVAAFDSMPIPIELRKLACERRLARDLNGSTPPEGGCERFDREEGGAGRRATP